MKFSRREPNGKQRHLSVMIDADIHQRLQHLRIETHASVGKIVEDILRENLEQYGARYGAIAE